MTIPKFAALALLVILLAGASLAQDFATLKAKAPPTAPPRIVSSSKAKESSLPVARDGSQYLIGDPTDEEQLFLELINRARQDATAEAQRILALTDPLIVLAIQQFHVDTNLMLLQFSTNPPVPPLSFNAKLMTAARNHSQYQLDNGVQTHFETGATFGLADRFNVVGYVYSNGGENVFAYASEVEQGHAGFEVDWGGSVGGMQSPPGHRDSIHGRFVEVGIRALHGSNTVPPNEEVGPMIVTEDFGSPFGSTRFITGVAYYDLNGNNFYDVGEGLGGVTVTVDGSSAFAITTASGGYSIPVAGNGSYNVRFNMPGATEMLAVATVNSANVKIDYKPAYNESAVIPPAPSPVTAGIPNTFQFTKLAGATGYRARSFSLQTAPKEAGESLDNVMLVTTPGYNPISTSVTFSGKAFHLGHATLPAGGAVPQYIVFKSPYFVRAGAKIDFKTLHRLATPGETSKIEVSADEGVTWTAIYARAGNGTEQTVYSPATASLADFAGKLVQIRVNFDVEVTQGWYNILKVGDEAGWFIDEIVFTNVDQAVDQQIANLDASGSFDFVPPVAGNYLLQFQAVNGTRFFPWGSLQSVAVQGINTSTLTVDVLGVGSVTPDLTTSVLDVGKSYSVTAIPGTGYSFKGWSGDVTSASATLTFTMRPNMHLIAVFGDGLAPMVTITSPTGNLTTTNGIVTIQGTASDNIGVSAVEVSVGSGAFQTVTGTTSWSADINLAAGANQLRVRARDAAGNVSAEAKVTVTYNVPSAFAPVVIVGSGTVTPDLSKSNVVVGKTYSITATPALGFSFQGWSGNGILSAARTLTFPMQNTMNLTATFVDTTSPTLTVTSPRLNERITTPSPVVMLAGTAGDNASVAFIKYQLNGGVWNSIPGAANWQTPITLLAGPNTIKVYAEDPAGRHSPTNTVTCTFVVTAPLSLTVSPGGKVIGATNGQRFEIGKSVTVTATPNVGFAFTGWSGTTNKSTAALTFVMQQDFALTASFRDSMAPTIAITAPKAAERILTALPTILLKGTSKDNSGATAIHYQLNGGAWKYLAGAANWQDAVDLIAGSNSIRAYAEDAVGNHSSTSSVTCTFVVTAPLGLVVNPGGRVTGATNTQRLEIGKSYTITATPNVGFAFNGWSGSTNKSTPSLTFVMRDGFAVTADFRDNTAPTLAITSPTASQVVTNENVVIRGTATDNVGVEQVTVQIDGGTPAPAIGTSNWSVATTLSRGTHTVKAYATDARGLNSKTNAVTFTIPSFTGVYFGTYAAAHSKGVIGMLVRADQNTSILIGENSGTNSHVVAAGEGGVVAPNGGSVAGKFTATGATGSLLASPGETATFSSVKTAGTGTRAADVGVYQGVFTSANDNIAAFVMLAADGQFVLIGTNLNNGLAGGIRGTLATQKTITSKFLNVTFQGTLDSSTHTISGTFANGAGTFVLTRVITTSSPFGGAMALSRPAPAEAIGEIEGVLFHDGFVLSFGTQAGRRYTIQASDDFENWLDIASFEASDERYEHHVTPTEAQKFFRIVAE